MGWFGGNSLRDANVELSGEIEIKWTCPRCKHRNANKVDASVLMNGDFIYCQNTAVCGEEQSYINLGCLSADISYKG